MRGEIVAPVSPGIYRSIARSASDGHGHGHGVADDHGARGDDRGWTPAERQDAARLGHARRSFVATRYMCGADIERLGAEGVGQHHAEPIATEADVRDLAEGLIGDVEVRVAPRWALVRGYLAR